MIVILPRLPRQVSAPAKAQSVLTPTHRVPLSIAGHLPQHHHGGNTVPLPAGHAARAGRCQWPPLALQIHPAGAAAGGRGPLRRSDLEDPMYVSPHNLTGAC